MNVGNACVIPQCERGSWTCCMPAASHGTARPAHAFMTGDIPLPFTGCWLGTGTAKMSMHVSRHWPHIWDTWTSVPPKSTYNQRPSCLAKSTVASMTTSSTTSYRKELYHDPSHRCAAEAVLQPLPACSERAFGEHHPFLPGCDQ